MRILLVNPNITTAITDAMAAEARRVASAGTQILAVTAAFGTQYVATRNGEVLQTLDEQASGGKPSRLRARTLLPAALRSEGRPAASRFRWEAKPVLRAEGAKAEAVPSRPELQARLAGLRARLRPGR